MESKKTRGKNFVDEEIIYLLNLVEKNKRIIENKKTNAITNDQKATTWKLVEKQFNKMFPLNTRTADKLMTKYDNVKQLAKKYAAKRRQAEVGTSGGPCLIDVNIIYEKTLQIINKRIVHCEKCEYDCDNEENTSEDFTLLLREEATTNKKEETADVNQADPTETESYELANITPSQPPKIGMEGKDVASISTQTEIGYTTSLRRKRERSRLVREKAHKLLKTKEKYYNVKMKYLETEIALKEEELKEKREQEHLKFELLKLQLEGQRLVILEKKRKLQLE